MLPVIPGSLWRILLTVRMLFVLLSRLAGWSYLAPRRLRLRTHAAELRLRCSLLGIPWTRALVTSVQPWWAGAFCTGGRPTAGNLERSRVSAHLPPPALLTWWPTPGKPRRYAERRTRCWMLLRTGNAGCCFHHWHLLELSEFPGGTASWSRRPYLGIEFGLCSVTGSTRP
jgi:hypothetical protein